MKHFDIETQNKITKHFDCLNPLDPKIYLKRDLYGKILFCYVGGEVNTFNNFFRLDETHQYKTWNYYKSYMFYETNWLKRNYHNHICISSIEFRVGDMRFMNIIIR